MDGRRTVPPGEFCWLDLAATDAGDAARFYERLFGWRVDEQVANGGHFSRLRSAGRDVGSLYQLGRASLALGARAHWTPYVRVLDADEAARRASDLGGTVLVQPFDVDGVARIALIADAVGAQLGLWQTIDGDAEDDVHA